MKISFYLFLYKINKKILFAKKVENFSLWCANPYSIKSAVLRE
jgi:hypothetical protein